MSISLAALADDTLLERAFAWLCRQRKDWPAACDVWDLCARWPAAKAELQAELRAEEFRFGLLSRVSLPTGEEVDLWSARDALVLKALALVVGARLPFPPRCMHVKGHGGAKAAVRQLLAQLPQQRFVLKTDVKSYYASPSTMSCCRSSYPNTFQIKACGGYCGNTCAGVPSAGDCSTTSSAGFRSVVRKRSINPI